MPVLLPGVNESIANRAVPAQLPAAATETILTGSSIVLTKPLAVGDKFRWRVSMTKTAAGTGNTAFLVKTNTSQTVATGTTGGAATALTLTGTVAETAAIGSAFVEIEVVVQKADPTTGVVFGKLEQSSNAGAAVGFSNQSVAAIGTGLVTDNTIQAVGLAITSGAADVVTVNYVEATAS